MPAQTSEAQTGRPPPPLPLPFIDVAVCFPAGVASPGACGAFFPASPSSSEALPSLSPRVGRVYCTATEATPPLDDEHVEFGRVREFGRRRVSGGEESWTSPSWSDEWQPEFREFPLAAPAFFLGSDEEKGEASNAPSRWKRPFRPHFGIGFRQGAALPGAQTPGAARTAPPSRRRAASRRLSCVLATLCFLALALGFVWASCAASWLLGGSDTALRLCPTQTATEGAAREEDCLLAEEAARLIERHRVFQRAYDAVYGLLVVLSLWRLALVPSSLRLRHVIVLRFACCACGAAFLKFCVSLLTARRVLGPRVAEALFVDWAVGDRGRRLLEMFRLALGSLTSEAVDAAPGWGVLVLGLLVFFWCTYSWRNEPPWLFMGAAVAAVTLLVLAASSQLRNGADVLLSPAAAACGALAYHALLDEAAKTWFVSRFASAFGVGQNPSLDADDEAKAEAERDGVALQQTVVPVDADFAQGVDKDQLSGCSTGVELGAEDPSAAPFVKGAPALAKAESVEEANSLSSLPTGGTLVEKEHRTLAAQTAPQKGPCKEGCPVMTSRPLKTQTASPECVAGEDLEMQGDFQVATLAAGKEALAVAPCCCSAGVGDGGFFSEKAFFRLALCVASLERLFERLAEAVEEAEKNKDARCGTHWCSRNHHGPSPLLPCEGWAVVTRTYAGAPFAVRRTAGRGCDSTTTEGCAADHQPCSSQET